MGTLVTYPREKHADGKPIERREIKEELDREIFARRLLENVRNWIDSDEDVINSMGMPNPNPPPQLTDEECKTKADAGEGTYGHSTIIEPADLDLYSGYLYPPLRMPEKPQVMVSYWDMNREPVNFMEGRIMIKALCPDGIESWLTINIPVPNFYTALEGNAWGWPKYVADEMTVTKEHSEVIYEGKPSLLLDFTPGGVDDTTMAQLKEQGTEGGNTVSFHMATGTTSHMTLLRQGTGPKSGRGGYVAEWEAGMIRTWGRPEDKWSGLLPEDCVTPGFWQRTVARGGPGGGAMYKVKNLQVK